MKYIYFLLSSLALYFSAFSFVASSDTLTLNKLDYIVEKDSLADKESMSAYFNKKGELLIKCDEIERCDFIDIELAVKAVIPSGWSVSLPSIIEVNHDYGGGFNYPDEELEEVELMELAFGADDEQYDFDEKLMIEFYGPNGEHVGYNSPNKDNCRAEAAKYNFCDNGVQPTSPFILKMLSTGLGLDVKLEAKQN